MSESTKKPVADRRAAAHSRGIWPSTTDAEHPKAQAGIIESGVWPRGTSPGSTVNVCSSDWGVAASARGSDQHDLEPLRTDGADI
jgi:hypothetical protein